MKLLIVRHGDPDYSIDSLTEKGWREADYLSERLAVVNAEYYYVSPLGRAKDTASLTLKKVHGTATECPWLREFKAPIWRPDVPGQKSYTWDWLPQDWMAEARFFHPDQWWEPRALHIDGVKLEYNWVVNNFDALLECHGYKRVGFYYQALQPNNDTIVFFCHFGVECVLLSHLLNISPMVLWHGMIAAPTSVTTVVTEERRKGIASFRVCAFGDTSHLYQHDELPSFSGRFCECYGNPGERTDTDGKSLQSDIKHE